MVRQHKHRNVIRRVLPPPALPVLIRPRATNRPEHVAPQDPGTNIRKPAHRKVIVNAGRPAALSGHLVKEPRGKDPLMHRLPAHPQRVLHTLIRTGPKPIERYTETVNTELCHGRSEERRVGKECRSRWS